ncbi:MAG: 50S ribosome-binding GTPase [Phycisphaerales bacterium]|nr:50S ribosome-binding GTPase [Phycisphaerales bacterium]MCB9864177.1 50S ribosome-binding GTPase [Phycisphaerales bacterium]
MSAPAPTYVAVLTPESPGAIAVVAVSGDGAGRLVAPICRRRNAGSIERFDAGLPRLVQIMDGEQVLDDAIVSAFTIGDVPRIELNLHGGVRIVQRVVGVLERVGGRLISATAFEDRFGGRSSFDRDVDKALMVAGSRRLAIWLMAQRRALPSFFSEWSTFNDEEITAFRRRSEAAIRLIRGVRVALVGPPNAGKSTLANRLIGHERVIVSSEAGTTRDWIDETAIIDGWPVTLTDTAGVRDTHCEIESEAIRRGAAQARSSDLVLAIVDATEPADSRRRSIEATLSAVSSDAPTLVVVNKTDAVSKRIEPATAAEECWVSALSGDGMELLEHRIADALKLNELDSTEPTGFFPAHLYGRPETEVERTTT